MKGGHIQWMLLKSGNVIQTMHGYNAKEDAMIMKLGEGVEIISTWIVLRDNLLKLTSLVKATVSKQLRVKVFFDNGYIA